MNIAADRETIECKFENCKEFISVSPRQKQKFCKTTHNIDCYICGSLFETASKQPNRTCSKYCQQKLFEETSFSRYGVKNAGGSEESLRKNRATSLERFGVEHSSQADSVKEKSVETNLRKRGVPYHSQDPVFKEKIKEIFENRHGGRGMGSPTISEKIKKTNVARYGAENPFQSPDHQEKTKKTNLEKYGTEYPIFKKSNQSKPEKELFDFIESIYLGPLTKDRKLLKGKELDFYLPELRLAIEFNGDYWHADIETMKDKDGLYPSYWHEWKWENCRSHGIDLFFVWEKDWKEDKDEVKGIIFNLILSYEEKRFYGDYDFTFQQDTPTLAESYNFLDHTDEINFKKTAGKKPAPKK